MENTKQPLIYDTACERELTGPQPDVDSLEYDYRWRYRDTLAEPVAVIDWQPEVASTWQVLYATNRGRSGDDGPQVAQYGNEVMPTPAYGACAVTLPHRPRGQDTAAQTEADDSASAAKLQVVQPLDEDAFFGRLNELVRRSRQQDVLLFVHGFNVSYEDAVTRAAQVAADLPFNGAVVVYSWPSQGGVKNYSRDGEVVDESVPAFTQFLTALGERVPREAAINIVVHSMGNRLVQRSLWQLPDEFTAPPRFSEIVFCAPDVGVEEFRRNMRRAQDVAGRVTLYTCANDTALIVSMFFNREDRAGSPVGPVLIEGMDTIETTVVDTSTLGHSYYGSNRTVLRDLFAIVKEHQPIEDRPWFKRQKIPFQKAPLWIFNTFPTELVWHWHFEEPADHILPAAAIH